jgi:hypothetical protein
VSPRPSRTPPWIPEWLRRAYAQVAVWGCVALALSLFATRSFFALGLVGSLAVGVFLGEAAARRSLRRLAWTVALGFGAVIVVNLAEEFVDPRPLPEARIVRRDGTTIEGGLIASTGSQWFIARKDGFVSIPVDRVRRTEVEFVEHSKPHSPACIAFGRFCDE